MPELPEVERAVRRLRHVAVGRTITAVRVLHRSQRRGLPPRRAASLVGARIVAVARRGKHQFIVFADGRSLHAHFRMTGDWTFDRVGDEAPRFARAWLELDDGSRVVLDDPRALSTIAIMTAAQREALALGVDADDPSLTPAALFALLRRKRSPIKVALLDQRLLAGIGNIYASEALWRSRIDPRAIAGALGETEVASLLSAIRHVLAKAGGDRYADGGGRFLVYDREGRPCRRCRVSLARIVQTGRSTYFCPRCQRLGKPRLSSRPRATRP